MKTKRSPRSASTGPTMLGRISDRMQIESVLPADARDSDEVHRVNVYGKCASKAIGSGSVDDRQRQNQHRDRGADGRDDHKAEQLAGDRIQRVEDTAQDRINPAAGDGGDHAKNHAAETGNRHGCERDTDGIACAHQDSREHVAAEIVRAQLKITAHRAEIIDINDLTDRVGDHKRCKDCNERPRTG